MSAPSGTLIAYATAPGSTAADGFGRNGVYTKHILQQIRVPDMPAEIMFKRVREGVEQETPAPDAVGCLVAQGRLRVQFAPRPRQPHGRADRRAGRAAPTSRSPIELQFWLSVKDSTGPTRCRPTSTGIRRALSRRSRARGSSRSRGHAGRAGEAPTMRAAPVTRRPRPRSRAGTRAVPQSPPEKSSRKPREKPAAEKPRAARLGAADDAPPARQSPRCFPAARSRPASARSSLPTGPSIAAA
jgi:hypothetical protein